MQNTATENQKPMAKKKRTDGLPATRPVKFETSLFGKAEMIARDKGIPTSDYISEICRATIERDWIKLVRKVDEIK